MALANKRTHDQLIRKGRKVHNENQGRPSKKRRSSPDPELESSSDDRAHGDADGAAEQEGLNGINQPENGQEDQKTFRDLGIIEPLCEACANLGFKKPTPIQTETIPLALEGRDMIGLAETGSGKTAAFALPILQALMEKPQKLFAMVLAPTRELAYQTSQQFSALGSLIAVRTAVIVGGMDMVSQAIALSKNPHVVIATPGRLLDHLENTKGFSLRSLKYLVIDEADRLLDMDFGPILTKILNEIPREGRKTYLFSATMSSKIEPLQRASLQNPVRISVKSNHPLAISQAGEGYAKYQTVSTLQQSFLFIPHKHKDFYLLALLSGPFAGHSSIIFARTVNEVARVTYLLRALGLGAIPLHGQLSQSSRLSALNKFKAHSRDILVATDVAARGLDIPSVDLVLNHDLPGDSATYVHRVGRTARAGKSGHAVSLVTQYDVEVWLRIEKALGKKVEEYKGLVKEEVLMLSEEVSEAQRTAIRQLKDEQAKKEVHKKGKTRGVKWKRDEMDKDVG